MTLLPKLVLALLPTICPLTLALHCRRTFLASRAVCTSIDCSLGLTLCLYLCHLRNIGSHSHSSTSQAHQLGATDRSCLLNLLLCEPFWTPSLTLWTLRQVRLFALSFSALWQVSSALFGPLVLLLLYLFRMLNTLWLYRLAAHDLLLQRSKSSPSRCRPPSKGWSLSLYCQIDLPFLSCAQAVPKLSLTSLFAVSWFVGDQSLWRPWH